MMLMKVKKTITQQRKEMCLWCYIVNIVTELFTRDRKRNISVVFVSQSHLKVLKDIRLNAAHYFVMKIPNKRELQQTASNHSSDMEFKDFMKLYKDYSKELFLFVVNDTNLPSDNP